PAVWLMHSGDDAGQHRAPGEESESQRRGDPLGDQRQHLPLHGLYEHRQSDPVRGQASDCRPGRRGRMSSTMTIHGGIGESIKRKEDGRFLRRKGNYVDDHVLPGMLHMSILRSPHAHARIKSIDTSAAGAKPGVIAVVTGELMAQHKLAWMPTLSGDTQAALAPDKVRFQGQEVAAVIAETKVQAEDARDAIVVDYDVLPAVISPDG